MKRAFEEDFPRGGGGGGGGGGGAAANDEVPRRAKKRVLALPRLDLEARHGDDGGPGVSGKVPTFVEQLKYKSLSVGTKLLGCVVEATATRLLVALPSGLRGTIRAAEASDAHAEHLRTSRRAAAGGVDGSGSDDDDEERDADADAAALEEDPNAPPPLHAQFAPGQLLRCVVVALGAGAGDGGAAKRVELSARLSRVVGALPLAGLRAGRALPATVRSVEDHGYVLCLGPAKASGFLPRALAGTEAQLRPGAHLEAVVTAVDVTRRVVAVTAAHAAVAAAALSDGDDVALAALLPGSLVPAKVRAVLPDGLQLTFLTYFTGTVDWFHIDTPFPTPGALGASYAVGAKCKARVLWVDAATKRVGLTLRRRLVELAPPPPLPAIGTRFAAAVVRRVDPEVGLLCALPAAEGGEGGAADAGGAHPARGYVHISAVADTRVEKLEKRFKRGQEVEARVVGARPLEDLAVLSLKPSVLRAAFFAYAEVVPGALVDCVVEAVDATGATLSLGAGLRARAATQHLSDTGAPRAAAKLRPGAAVRGRVLSVDVAARRVAVTLKPALVGSRHPALAAPLDAPPGAVGHGVVTGVMPYGVFVAFYGALRGLAHVSHLGLEGGQTPSEAFAPGQVVKCTVLGATAHPTRGVVLDLAIGASSKKGLAATATNGAAEPDAAALPPYEALQEVPSATVLRVVASGRRGVEVALPGGASAFLEEAQLADSGAAASALLDALAPLPPGTQLGPLLVMARAPGGRLALSRKPALRAAAATGALPRTYADCAPGQLLAGYVAGVTAAGVFVRFAERLTGLAPPAQLSDGFVASPSASAFTMGQTVAARVYTVDAAAGRLALSLKPSACRGEGAPALRSALAAAAEIDALAAAASGESAEWADAYPPGRKLDATVAEVKAYGTVLDIAGDEAAVGFALPAQAAGAPGGAPAAGAAVRAVVLDVNRREGVVDVGLRAELLAAKGSSKGSAAAKAPKLGASVAACVELVKPDYLVCSLPKHGAALAFMQLGSFNARPDTAADAFTVGQTLSAVVAEHASDATGGRMLLLPAAPAGEAADGEAPARGRAQQATVVSVRPTEAHLRLDNGRYGRLHATSMPTPVEAPPAVRGKRGAAAAVAAASASALAALTSGAELRVFVIGHARGDPAPDGKSFLELALPGEDGGPPRAEDAPCKPIEALSPGDSVWGVIESVAADGAWIALSPLLRGRLACLDGSADADEASAFAKRLRPGQRLACAVLQVDAPRRHLDLTTRAKPDAPLKVGQVLPGRVTRAVPGVGLYVQLPAHKAGRVALTDLCDVYSDAPLDGFEPGTVVSAVVVATGSDGRVDLSLRASRGGSGPAADASDERYQAELVAAADVSPGALVWGYVRQCSPKGCFVALGRGLDARVLLSNLSDTFVPAPAAAFPPGALVRGRVLAVDAASGRVELSLKASEASGAPLLALGDLAPGQTVRGTVKRCEVYGAFIAVDGSALVGMCHISEAADTRVKDLAKLLRPGQRVRARVLAADTDTGRLSLGLKPSYFGGEPDDEEATGGPAAGVDALAAYAEDDDGEEGGAGADNDDDDAEPGSENEMEEAEDDEDAEAMDADHLAVEEDKSESEPPPPPKKGRTVKPPSGAEIAQRMRDAPSAWAPPPAEDDELAFQWADARPASATAGAADDDDVAETGAPSAAAAKKARKRARDAAEAAIRERERALAGGDAAPSSAADFERALLGSPDSSFLWIRYMAHLVSLGEVAAARAVAERALGDGGIGYREQKEQLNVWVAWLNLENAYGAPTPDAAVTALFARAVQRNDAKKLHLARVGLHERAGQAQQAQKAAAALTRRFPGSCKAWLRAHAAHLAAAAGDAARGVLDAAVAALPRRKHAKLLVGAALAEFRAGDAERGRALLEGVLAAHPKRLDVWGVYLDAEAKAGDAERTRALFERAVHLDLPPRKAKSLFKRYLAHEEAQGDAAGIARVKQLAADYVAQRGV